MEPKSNRIEERDGGWGWFVVFASAISVSLWTACMRCYSTFFYPLMNEFNAEYGAVSWLYGLFQIGYGISSAFVPVLFKYLDYRKVVMGGGLISSSLLMLGSFANSLWLVQVCCSWGVGLCMGCILTGCFTCITRYFEKRRVLAIQIATLGVSLGGFAYGPFFQFLIDFYSWRGAMQIISGVFLHTTVLGALLRPVILVEDTKQSKTPSNAEYEEGEVNWEQSLSHTKSVPVGSKNDSKPSPPSSQVVYNQQNSIFSCMRVGLRHLYHKLDLIIFFRIDFYLFVLVWTFYVASCFSILGYLVPYGQSIGFGNIDAATLVSAYAVGEIGSRIFYGLVLNRIKSDYRYPVVAGMKLAASGCFFAIPFISFYTALLALCGLIGFLIGGIDAIYLAILADLFGVKLYAAAFGYSGLVCSAIGMGVSVSVGTLIEISETVGIAFEIGGALLIVSIFLLLLIDRRIKTSNQRNRAKSKSRVKHFNQ